MSSPATAIPKKLTKDLHPVTEPPKEIPTQSLSIPLSPLRVRSSQLRDYITKRRWLLLTGILLALSAMVIGIIFVVHRVYVELGGQGFLKAREEPIKHPWPNVFLPQRQIQFELKARGRANVAYYTCGDQLDSCLRFEKPNICCPVNTYCHGLTKHTLSGVYCCNATSSSDCNVSKDNPPQCPQNTFECTAQTGGGCCEMGTICTPNGCVRILGPSIISDGLAASTPSSMKPYSAITVIENGNAAVSTGSVIISTVTERPAATITDVKQGELAQNDKPHQHSGFVSLCLPYLLASLALSIALLMGLL